MNFSTMNEAQLKKYYADNINKWRKNLARLTSFLNLMYSKVYSAFASGGVTITDMSGQDGSVDIEFGAHGHIKMVSFEGPQLAKAQRFIRELAMVDDLLSQQSFIERLDALGAANLEMKKLAEKTRRIYNETLKAYNNSLKAAKELADDTIPDAVGKIFKSAQKQVAKLGDCEAHGLVGVNDGVVDFVQSIDISNIQKSIDHEDQHEEAIVVVITCRLQGTDAGAQLSVYLNILDRLALPFRYNLGAQLKYTDSTFASKFAGALKLEMARHHVVGFIGPEPINVDNTLVKSVLSEINGVTDIDIEEKSINFRIEHEDKAILNQVMFALRNIRDIKKVLKNGVVPNAIHEGDGYYRYTLVQRG